MPAAISRTTEGMRTEGTSPRPSGTTKAIAATMSSPVRAISGIMSTSYAVRCLDLGSDMSVHLDEYLDRSLLLGQEPYHLLVVVEALHRVGQQPLQPTRVLRRCQGCVLDTTLELGAMAVHRAHRLLVAHHETRHEVLSRNLVRAITAADSREHEHAVLAQCLHALEDHAAHARSLEDYVERAVLLSRIHQGHPARAHVARA